MAITPLMLGLIACTHCRKLASSCLGSMRAKTRPNVSWEGIPLGNLSSSVSQSCFALPNSHDPYPSVGSTDHPTNRSDDDIAQSMLLGSFKTWVLHLSKN